MQECLQCGKETKNPKFCSLSCSAKWGAEKRRREKIEPRNCLFCDKPTSNPKFCSSSCAAKYNNPLTKKIKCCLNCGKEVPSDRIYCDNTCQRNYQHKEYIQKWKEGFISGLTGYQVSDHISRYFKEKHNYSCSKCGWNIVNVFTRKVPLEIHHIDGNHMNNKEENLELLCPNCHSLTSNYKGANKEGTRVDRKKYQ